MAPTLFTLLSLLFLSTFTTAVSFDQHIDFIKRGTDGSEKPWSPPGHVQVLTPAIAPMHKFNKLDNLVPKFNISLFHAPEDRGPLTSATISTLRAEFIYKAVALEHCGAIENVQCANNNKMVITLSNKKAVETIEKEWPHQPFVLITYHEGCPSASYKEGARSYYVVESWQSSWIKGKYQITANIVEREIHEVLKGGTLEWGSYTPSNNHRYQHKTQGKTTKDCDKPKHGKHPRHPKHGKHPKHPKSTKHPKHPKHTKTTNYPTGTGVRTSGPTSFSLPVPSGVLIGDCKNDACLSALSAAANHDVQQDDQEGDYEDETEAEAANYIEDALPGLGIDDSDEFLEYYQHDVATYDTEAAQQAAANRINHKKRNVIRKRFGLPNPFDLVSAGYNYLAQKADTYIVQPAKDLGNAIIGFVASPNATTGANLIRNVPSIRIAAALTGAVVGPIGGTAKKTYSLEVPSASSNIGKTREVTPFKGEKGDAQNGIVLFKAQSQTANSNAQFNVWCVGCGIKGTLTIAGTATFDVSSLKFTEGRLDVMGGLELQLAVGVQAQYTYSRKYAEPLFEVPIGPFSIPKVATVGFTVVVGVVASFDANANGQLLAGFRLTWPEGTSTIDFVNPQNTNLGPIQNPVFLPLFEASGTIDLQATFGPSLGLQLGISVLPSLTKSFTLNVALVDAVVLGTRATFTAGTVNTGGVECFNGVNLGYSVTNRLFVSINNEEKYGLSEATLAGGNKCISFAGTATTPIVDPSLSDVPAGPTGIEDGDPTVADDGPTTTPDEPTSTDDGSESTATSEDPAPTGNAKLNHRSHVLAARQYVNLTQDAFSEQSPVMNDTQIMAALNNNPSEAQFASIAANIAAQPLEPGVDINATDKTGSAFLFETTPILSTNGELALIPGFNGDLAAINLKEAGTTADFAAGWVAANRKFILSDIDNRILHLYSDEMADGGVSRIRLAALDQMPKNGLIVRLLDIQGRLVAAGFENQYYALVLCGLRMDDLLLEKIYAVNINTYEQSFKRLEGLKAGNQLSGGEITTCATFPWRSSLMNETPTV